MKATNTIVVNYRHGLCSFLDENCIEWEALNCNDKLEPEDRIKIYLPFTDLKLLWKLAIEFGDFYHNQNNY